MSMRELLIVAVLVGCAAKSNAPPPVNPPPGEPATPTEPAPTAQAQPDGGPCLKAEECTSGICEGQGCGAEQPGVCAPKQRGCTRDRREYCNCDGATFFASGSCPGQRFRAKGACTASAP